MHWKPATDMSEQPGIDAQDHVHTIDLPFNCESLKTLYRLLFSGLCHKALQRVSGRRTQEKFACTTVRHQSGITDIATQTTLAKQKFPWDFKSVTWVEPPTESTPKTTRSLQTTKTWSTQCWSCSSGHYMTGGRCSTISGIQSCAECSNESDAKNIMLLQPLLGTCIHFYLQKTVKARSYIWYISVQLCAMPDFWVALKMILQQISPWFPCMQLKHVQNMRLEQKWKLTRHTSWCTTICFIYGKFPSHLILHGRFSSESSRLSLWHGFDANSANSGLWVQDHVRDAGVLLYSVGQHSAAKNMLGPLFPQPRWYLIAGSTGYGMKLQDAYVTASFWFLPSSIIFVRHQKAITAFHAEFDLLWSWGQLNIVRCLKLLPVVSKAKAQEPQTTSLASV